MVSSDRDTVISDSIKNKDITLKQATTNTVGNAGFEGVTVLEVEPLLPSLKLLVATQTNQMWTKLMQNLMATIIPKAIAATQSCATVCLSNLVIPSQTDDAPLQLPREGRRAALWNEIVFGYCSALKDLSHLSGSLCIAVDLHTSLVISSLVPLFPCSGGRHSVGLAAGVRTILSSPSRLGQSCTASVSHWL